MTMTLFACGFQQTRADTFNRIKTSLVLLQKKLSVVSGQLNNFSAPALPPRPATDPNRPPPLPNRPPPLPPRPAADPTNPPPLPTRPAPEFPSRDSSIAIAEKIAGFVQSRSKLSDFLTKMYVLGKSEDYNDYDIAKMDSIRNKIKAKNPSRVKAYKDSLIKYWERIHTDYAAKMQTLTIVKLLIAPTYSLARTISDNQSLPPEKIVLLLKPWQKYINFKTYFETYKDDMDKYLGDLTTRSPTLPPRPATDPEPDPTDPPPLPDRSPTLPPRPATDPAPDPINPPPLPNRPN